MGNSFNSTCGGSSFNCCESFYGIISPLSLFLFFVFLRQGISLSSIDVFPLVFIVKRLVVFPFFFIEMEKKKNCEFFTSSRRVFSHYKWCHHVDIFVDSLSFLLYCCDRILSYAGESQLLSLLSSLSPTRVNHPP